MHLPVLLPRPAIEAFERAAATLAMAEPGTTAERVMEMMLAGFSVLDLGERLARNPIPAGPREVAYVPASRETAADLILVGLAFNLEADEVASRILAAIAREGPASAIRAINSRRAGRRARRIKR
ncbi:MAG: hypothetical protein FJZ01_14805 [Candidatus Sericytochromatia bacterium]|nr:hypothetical protein [Candidatus Tanganyikabacteria bacterium]